MEIDPGTTAGRPSGVSLRPVGPRDVDWIESACQDADIQRWTTVPRPYTRAHAEAFAGSGGIGDTTWAIVDDDDHGLGMISIHGIDPGTGDADAGYWVAPWARRRGVATWAIGALVERAAAREGVRAITLQIAETNAASRGAAIKAGFVNDGPNGCRCPDGEGTAPTLLYRRRVSVRSSA
jgi:RimJ/RimL family protein N-acetyltransferase